MASVNKVILVGNLGKPPQTRTFPNGDKVTNITLATSDRFKDRATGEMKESMEWRRVSFFGKLAEITELYLRQGASVYVEGSLRTRKWTDKDGLEKYTTEIRADSMQMLSTRPAQAKERTRDSGAGSDPCSSESATRYKRPLQRSVPPAQRSARRIPTPVAAPSRRPDASRAPHLPKPAMAGGGYSGADDIPFARHGHAKLHC